MDLFKTIEHGKYSKKLKKEAKHELSELGGEEKAEQYEKKVKASKRAILLKKKHGARM